MTDAEVHDEIMRMIGPLRPLHFNAPVGLIFAVLEYPGGFKTINQFTVVNNWTSLSKIRGIEKMPEFSMWAVDPFSGEIKHNFSKST